MNLKAILVLALTFLAYSGESLTVMRDVEDFVRNNRMTGNRRSGEIAHGKQSVFGTPSKASNMIEKLQAINAQRFKGWEGVKFCEFSVRYPDLTDKEITAYFKKNLGNSGLTNERIEKEIEGDVWVIELPIKEEKNLFARNWHNTDDLLSMEQLKGKGVSALRRHLKQFSGSLEYQTHEVSYEAINGKKVITEFRLRFARVFQGGFVFRNISYAYIVMDGRGKLKRIRIKWPTFEGLESPVGEVLTEQNALSRAIEFCQKGKHVKPWRLEDDHVVNTTVGSVARGWLPRVVGQDLRISPALSFATETETANGHKLRRFVNVPLPLEYAIDEEYSSRLTALNGKVEDNLKRAPVIRTTRE